MKKAPFILFFLFLPLIVCGQNTREDLDKIFQDASADLTSEVDGFNAYEEEALEEYLKFEAQLREEYEAYKQKVMDEWPHLSC